MKNIIKLITEAGYDFKNFQELWVERETSNTDDEEALIDALYEADDFEELLTVIQSWSRLPLEERIKEFLGVKTYDDPWLGMTLAEIIKEFKDGSDNLTTPEVVKLIDILDAKINLAEGLISREQYEKILG